MESRHRPARLVIETSARGIDEVVVRVPRGQRPAGLALLRLAAPGLEVLDRLVRRAPAPAEPGDSR